MGMQIIKVATTNNKISFEDFINEVHDLYCEVDGQHIINSIHGLCDVIHQLSFIDDKDLESVSKDDMSRLDKCVRYINEYINEFIKERLELIGKHLHGPRYEDMTKEELIELIKTRYK